MVHYVCPLEVNYVAYISSPLIGPSVHMNRPDAKAAVVIGHKVNVKVPMIKK